LEAPSEARLLSKVQSVDQRMRLGMRFRLSPAAERAVAHVRAAMGHEETSLTLSDTRLIE